MKFELLVFDWDGTLINSEERIVDCVLSAFTENALEPPSREAARNVIGLGLREAMCVLWPDGDDDRLDLLIDSYRHHFLVVNTSPLPLFPGAGEVIRDLHGQDYLLAVATGKSKRGLDRDLGDTGLGPYFHATRCADQAVSKPHPQMLHELLDELGVSAHDALMIGDTEYDLHMAANAGVRSLAVCYGAHAPERLLALEPLGCLSAMNELPGWLRDLESD